MIWKSFSRPLIVPAVTALLVMGCDRATETLEPAPTSTDPMVFDDDFSAGGDYQAFLDSKVDAVNIDSDVRHDGTASLRITVPGPGDPSGFFAGGAFTTTIVRDLSGYDALTFWARSSMDATLDVAGLGNDNTGFSKYEASRTAIPLTGTWTKHAIAIPLPEMLALEHGLFFFAEGHENDMGYDIWFDEVKFERLGTITNPRPTMLTRTIGAFVGGVIEIEGTQVTLSVGGEDQTIQHLPDYFTFASSDETVVQVREDGDIRVVGSGSASLTAMLGETPATGTLTLNTTSPPTTPAPTPSLPDDDVISLFSNVYTDSPVDKWSADWDQATVTDLRIAGDDVKAYTDLSFAGIEFIENQVDASSLTHFHMDVWAAPGASVFRVKLIDFGANGEFGGGDDREHELSFTGASDPQFVAGSWASLDIPLAAFTALTSTANLAQFIISGNATTAYLDNIYFH